MESDKNDKPPQIRSRYLVICSWQTAEIAFSNLVSASWEMEGFVLWLFRGKREGLAVGCFFVNSAVSKVNLSCANKF